MELSEDIFYEVPVINLEEMTIEYNQGSINIPEKLQGSGPSNINQDKNNIKAKKSQSTKNNEPLIINVDDSEKDNDCDIIYLIDSQENQPQNANRTSKYEDIDDFEVIRKENKLIGEIIEKCLDMEYTDGMFRIIKRTLIPLYKNADEAFKKSDMFQKMLSQIIIKLETEPNKKFSHLRVLCETLKLSKQKVRVSLITLKSNLNGKFSTTETTFSAQNRNIPRKRKIMDVIDLDDDDDVIIDCNSDTDIQINDMRGQTIDDISSSVQVINDYDSHVEINDTENDSDIQLNEQIEEDDDVIVIDETEKSNKENKTDTKHNLPERSITIRKSRFTKMRKEKDNLNSEKSIKENKIDTEHNNLPERSNTICKSRFAKMRKKDNLNNNEAPKIDLCNDENDTERMSNVLDPNVLPESVTREIPKPQYDIKEHINHIEHEIAIYSAIVKALEEKEVANDSLEDSPYIQCDMYKAQIVSLYKELCKLTGKASVKRHKVRLKVAAGRHAGPVRYLEDFINKNIDENGNLPFPDIHDVITCVRKANTQYNMGWNKKQIEAEARALFMYYGRTVQKRRQKREWRDLLNYVKEEAPDPADEDPTLQARLKENSKVAKKNEKDLIDRYAQIENSSAIAEQDLRLSLECSYQSEQDSDCGRTSVMNDVSEKINDNENSITINNNTESYDGHITDNLALINPSSALVQQAATFEGTIEPIYSVTDDQNEETLTTIIASTSHNFAVLINNPGPSSNVNSEQILTNIETVTDMTDIQKSLVIEHKETNEAHLKSNLEDGNIGSTSAAIQNNEVTTSFAERITVTNNDVDVKENVTDNREVPDSSDACEMNKDRELQRSDAGSSQIDFKNVKVKHEPLDIPYLLAQLGDNYTATIFEIEDPFMVVEISDSSESEDESGR